MCDTSRKLKTATRVAVFSIFFVLRRQVDDISLVIIFCIFAAFLRQLASFLFNYAK